MSDKNNFDDKIKNFSEIKKKLEEKKDMKDMSPDLNPMNLTALQEIFGKMGMDIDEQALSKALENFDLEDLLQSSASHFSLEDLEKGIESLKDYEKKHKQERQMYRSFSQWVPFRKPYTLGTLFQIEVIKSLADITKTAYTALDSKNNIIEKLIPNLSEYVRSIMMKLDDDMVNQMGKIIYSDGSLTINSALSEETEMKIDFFTSKALLARVNENGKHCIVIPVEIREILKTIDFSKVAVYNRLNTIINKTVIAFANSYGAYPKTLLYECVRVYAEDILKTMEMDNLEEHIDSTLAFSFARSLIANPLYHNVVFSDDYINHGIIEVTKNFVDIQNKNIANYKKQSLDEVMRKGSSYYFDDSIYLNEITSMIQEDNELDKVEVDQLKNQIYTFSFLEFEPDMILQILGMRYTLPAAPAYGKFIEIFRNYYKNSEKWVLKGHTSFEINHAPDIDANEDMKKIISFDYFNNK